jgi:hypothetical protein
MTLAAAIDPRLHHGGRILARLFSDQPDWLRFRIARTDADFARLATAFAYWKSL